MEEHLITQDNDFFYGGRRIVQELKILNIEAKHADPALGTCNFCRIGRVVLVMLNCQCSQSKIQRLHPVHGFPFKNIDLLREIPWLRMIMRPSITSTCWKRLRQQSLWISMEDYRFSAHFCNQKDRVKSRKILLIQLEFTVLSGGYHSQIESAKIDLNHVSPFGIFFFSFAMCFVSSELNESDQKMEKKTAKHGDMTRF